MVAESILVILGALLFMLLTAVGTAIWALITFMDTGEYPGGHPLRLLARFGLAFILGFITWLGFGLPNLTVIYDLLKVTSALALALIADGYFVVDAIERIFPKLAAKLRG